MLVDSTNSKYFFVFFHIDIAVTQKTLVSILSQDTTHLYESFHFHKFFLNRTIPLNIKMKEILCVRFTSQILGSRL